MGVNRYLIVNADDFGQSRGVNQGIIDAFERGVVTSTSLMVRWPAAEEAAEYCRRNANLSVGLHFELGEWAFRDGAWVLLYEVAPLNDEKAVREEAYRQLGRFHDIVHHDPVHIDSHQHVHLHDPTRTVLQEIADNIGVPLRHLSPIRYCGAFYGQTAEGEPLHGAITTDALIRILQDLGEGWTELCCHPARGADLTATMYSSEREMELHTLCDGAVRATIAESSIQLRSFRDFS